jgi:hypothetical protein
MAYRFLFADQFKIDVKESRKWYEEKQKGFGKKFYAEVKASLEAIKKTPHFQTRYDEVRCLPLKKYPFMIHFLVDEAQNRVLILACIHCSLNPHGHWLTEQ